MQFGVFKDGHDLQEFAQQGAGFLRVLPVGDLRFDEVRHLFSPGDCGARLGTAGERRASQFRNGGDCT